MQRKSCFLSGFCLVFCLLIPCIVLAVPLKVTYQGKLANPDGTPVDNGTYDIQFRIYNVVSGGTALWAETQSVLVMDGVYNVTLGSITPIPSGILDNPVLYLGVNVEADAEMFPRQEITSIFYALKAGDAETLEGHGSADFAPMHHEHSGADISSGTIDVDRIPPSIARDSELTWENLSGIPLDIADGDQVGLTQETDPTVPGWIKDGIAWSEVNGIPAGFADGVDNEGGLTLPYSGWYTSNQAAFWVTNHGPNGTAIWGLATADPGFGIIGQIDADGGAGVTGKHTQSGNYGEVGTALAGVRGVATGESGLGVYGQATGASARGVYGRADALGDVTNYGGYFVAKGDSGRGVFGDASGATAYGVYGRATNSGGSRHYGGYFTASGSDGVGVSAQGDTGIIGTGTTTGVLAASSGGTALWAVVSDGYGDGIYAEGGPQGGYAAQFKGNVLIRSKTTGATILEFGEGLDYAEGFDVSRGRNFAPGDVLVIDPQNPGKLTLSNSPYDRKVAGIIAGAHGLGSAVKIGSGGHDHNVALAGRVYCNVDTSYGKVSPGDLLTTSSTPGYAMVVKDYAKAQGAILGKAMEGLEEGKKGQILALVTLQ